MCINIYMCVCVCVYTHTHKVCALCERNSEVEGKVKKQSHCPVAATKLCHAKHITLHTQLLDTNGTYFFRRYCANTWSAFGDEECCRIHPFPDEIESLVHESIIGCSTESNSVKLIPASSAACCRASCCAFLRASSICPCCCCISTCNNNIMKQSKW